MLLVLILVTERLYTQPLYDYTVEELKRTYTPDKFEKPFFYFMLTLAYIGEGDNYIILAILAFILASRPTAFHFMAFFSTIHLVDKVAKISYRGPRPYWTDSEVIPRGCTSNYGHPSGHTIKAVGFFVFYFLDIFHG